MHLFVEPHALQLEADLEKRFPTLVPTLARTRSQVEAFWKHSNRLEHFTDHSHQHSRRVSSLANTLANARKNAGKVIRLNLLERYVLEQAAWVHDIGMQHIGAPDSRGPVTIDPDEVRKAHPRVSRDAVLGPLANGFQLDHGIPDEFSTLIRDRLACVLAWDPYLQRRRAGAPTDHELLELPDTRGATCRVAPDGG
ncbi:hypothetical protein PYV02_07495 [Leifsonia sp. H3M29-4]|nr:hypothetical protein [Salinibacterium metalliresistens]MDF1478929.1 hypothetical protein [Salinibacterium metalliresistens]